MSALPRKTVVIYSDGYSRKVKYEGTLIAILRAHMEASSKRVGIINYGVVRQQWRRLQLRYAYKLVKDGTLEVASGEIGASGKPRNVDGLSYIDGLEGLLKLMLSQQASRDRKLVIELKEGLVWNI